MYVGILLIKVNNTKLRLFLLEKTSLQSMETYVYFISLILMSTAVSYES